MRCRAALSNPHSLALSAPLLRADAYFVGRKQLLDWINENFQLAYTKIDECGTGAIHNQVLDRIFPGVVPMARVNFGAKQEYEFTENFKVFQTALDKLGIVKVVPVQHLVRCKYQVGALAGLWRQYGKVM